MRDLKPIEQLTFGNLIILKFTPDFFTRRSTRLANGSNFYDIVLIGQSTQTFETYSKIGKKNTIDLGLSIILKIYANDGADVTNQIVSDSIVNYEFCPTILANYLTTVNPDDYRSFIHDYYPEYDLLKDTQFVVKFDFENIQKDINDLTEGYQFHSLPGMTTFNQGHNVNLIPPTEKFVVEQFPIEFKKSFRVTESVTNQTSNTICFPIKEDAAASYRVEVQTGSSDAFLPTDYELKLRMKIAFYQDNLSFFYLMFTAFAFIFYILGSMAIGKCKRKQIKSIFE